MKSPIRYAFSRWLTVLPSCFLILNFSCNHRDWGFSPSPTAYFPRLDPDTVQLFLPQAVSEISGIIRMDSLLWGINDSGHENILYGIAPDQGTIQRQVLLQNGKNTDWEALTMDHTYLYVGDFGNNGGWRAEGTIYRINRSELIGSAFQRVNAEKIYFQYEDYPTSHNPFFHNYDCEAFVARDDSLYLFTKNRSDEHTNMYAVVNQPGTWTAWLRGNFPSQGQITDASWDSSQTSLVLLGYRFHPKWKTRIPFIWYFKDFPGRNFLSGAATRWDLDFRKQTEGITWAGSTPNRWWISSEKGKGWAPSLFEIYLPLEEKADSL